MHYTGDNFETYRPSRTDSVGRVVGDFIRSRRLEHWLMFGVGLIIGLIIG